MKSYDKYFSKIFARFVEIQYVHNAVLIRNIIMNILNFMQRFLDEASCIACLKEQREQSGIVCKYCVSVRNIVGMPTSLFSSEALSSQAALHSGTVMKHSKLPSHYWIAVMFQLTSAKKSFSTEEIHR